MKIFILIFFASIIINCGKPKTKLQITQINDNSFEMICEERKKCLIYAKHKLCKSGKFKIVHEYTDNNKERYTSGLRGPHDPIKERYSVCEMLIQCLR